MFLRVIHSLLVWSIVRTVNRVAKSDPMVYTVHHMTSDPHNIVLLYLFSPFGLVLLAYFIGAIPFGYLAGKMNGIDLREHGSRNIGATNAIRVLGKGWGIPVFLLDFLKGLLPLLIVKSYMGEELSGMSVGNTITLLAVMFALIIGHTFTVFLKFKGGKGVATTAGCLFALSPFVACLTLVAWVVCMILTRYVSLSSMVAGVVMVLLAVYEIIITDGAASTSDILIVSLLGLICVLVIVKHRSNISRIIDGTEPKAFSKK